MQSMSDKYWNYWNDEEQSRIDADIEKNRKADCCVKLNETGSEREVLVEQISHDFIFGAHIFNFDQLGSKELNDKYKALYGTLFNSATISFYWEPFEPEEGKMRFEPAPEDNPDFWAKCREPKMQRFWRRPPADPVVEFCESKKIRLHGHTLVWSNCKWQYPRWLMAKLPADVLAQMLTDTKNGTNIMNRPAAEVVAKCPEFAKALTDAIERRINTIAAHYKNRIHSWDVCNESAIDFDKGELVPGSVLTRSMSGAFMPGDYAFHAFQTAQKVFPQDVKLNINDYYLCEAYARQINDMISRGCKIDIMGLQMHLFNPKQCLDIAEGISDEQSPGRIRDMMKKIYVPGIPTHLSEITITSPESGPRGEEIQAMIARNLYRLWFSLEPMMGITWWNVVDDCGAPGEPSVSGIFLRDMRPKKAYYELNNLINKEWHTTLKVKTGADGTVSFRGFRGKYRLSWINDSGISKTLEVHNS